MSSRAVCLSCMPMSHCISLQLKQNYTSIRKKYIFLGAGLHSENAD